MSKHAAAARREPVPEPTDEDIVRWLAAGHTSRPELASPTNPLGSLHMERCLIALARMQVRAMTTRDD